jgi:hypothetical protein
MITAARLYALIAAIKQSPILVRMSERLLLARPWTSVRKSKDVDAYVLAWIASHVRGPRRPPRMLM